MPSSCCPLFLYSIMFYITRTLVIIYIIFELLILSIFNLQDMYNRYSKVCNHHFYIWFLPLFLLGKNLYTITLISSLHYLNIIKSLPTHIWILIFLVFKDGIYLFAYLNVFEFVHILWDSTIVNFRHESL